MNPSSSSPRRPQPSLFPARKRLARGLAAVAAGLLVAVAGSGCSDGNSGPDESPTAAIARELAASGFGDYLGVQSPDRSEENRGWTNWFYDPAAQQAICMNGSGYEASSYRGTNDQLLIYLEGGGACWDYLTCWVLKTAKTNANGADPSGAIDPSNPASPFFGWNVVYASYCDGSVFTGDHVADYQGQETWHHGLWNLSAAVDIATANFPNPSRIVVAGSSAGGYGTFAGYSVTRVAYPDTTILVYNDSGPGLQNPDSNQDVNDRVANWDFTKRIPPSCTECSTQYTFLLDWMLTRDPLARVAMYSYQEDGVISAFLDLSGPAYQSLLIDVTGEVRARHPKRLERFFPLGRGHTILGAPYFYTLSIGGVGVDGWTKDFLDDSSGWADIIE